MNDLPKRKHPRLEGYDYSQNGAYFVTFCVKDMRELLGNVVGAECVTKMSGGHFLASPPKRTTDAPFVQLSEHVRNTEEAIEFIGKQNHEITIAKYVIMPNHVHLLVIINDSFDGAYRNPRPTNAMIPKLISSI